MESEIAHYQPLPWGAEKDQALETIFSTIIEILKIDLQKYGVQGATLTQDHKDRIKKLIDCYHHVSPKVKSGIDSIIFDQHTRILTATKLIEQIPDLTTTFQNPSDPYSIALPKINRALQTFVEGYLGITHKPLTDNEDSRTLYCQLSLATSALREQHTAVNSETLFEIKMNVINELLKFAEIQHPNAMQPCSAHK